MIIIITGLKFYNMECILTSYSVPTTTTTSTKPQKPVDPKPVPSKPVKPVETAQKTIEPKSIQKPTESGQKPVEPKAAPPKPAEPTPMQKPAEPKPLAPIEPKPIQKSLEQNPKPIQTEPLKSPPSKPLMEFLPKHPAKKFESLALPSKPIDPPKPTPAPPSFSLHTKTTKPNSIISEEEEKVPKQLPKPILPPTKEVECPICEETFPTENACGQHIDDAHSSKPLSSSSLQMPPPPKKETPQVEFESPIKAQKQFSRLRKSNNNTFEWGDKRRKKDGKTFYSYFLKGGEKYTIGDHVEIEKESGFYIGKVSDMWEDEDNLWCRCKVYYMPEDTHVKRVKENGDNEIFDSENEFVVIQIVEIKGKCSVVHYKEYNENNNNSHVYYHKFKYLPHKKKFVNPEKPSKNKDFCVVCLFFF